MFRLPPLPYAPAALEPVLSAQTLETHHGKHHAKYVETTNALIADKAETFGSLEAVVRAAAAAGEHKLFNNAAQAWNHAFFWPCMTPEKTEPSEGLAAAIAEAFGGLAALKSQFVAEGVGHFGSGWVWLVVDGDALAVISTHDGETVLTGTATPLLVCDLWEHAYYLDHKNDRAGFLSAWWDRLVDWRFASAQYAAARAGAPAWRYADGFEDADPIEVSSPVCYAAEAGDAAMGYLEREDLIAELNVLLESERAGAMVAARLMSQVGDPGLQQLSGVIHGDEVKWCRMLFEALEALKAKPSEVIGPFYDKASAIPDPLERIAFLNRGQAWVVRKLRDLTPKVRDDRLHRNLQEMLAAHEQNIALAETALEQQAARAPN